MSKNNDEGMVGCLPVIIVVILFWYLFSELKREQEKDIVEEHITIIEETKH